MNASGTNVYLISGFLGSGKTSFLNHLLKKAQTDLKILVLINEFGEESIDGALVEDPELEMLEISMGSISCACVKGDFIKALYRIAFVIKPEFLVIEASGVANPTDIGRDLFNPIFKGMFKSLDKVCIIDAENFLEQYETFTVLENQMAASDKFIINKIDLVDRTTIERIKSIILEHTPKSIFLETSFGRISISDLASFNSKMHSQLFDGPRQEEDLLKNDMFEEFVDMILVNDATQVTPPDKLTSITYRWLSGSVDDFRNIAEKIPLDVVRAKGFIFENGKAYLYSQVGHSYTIKPFEGPRLVDKSVNRVVFIRQEFSSTDIQSMFKEYGLNLV